MHTFWGAMQSGPPVSTDNKSGIFHENCRIFFIHVKIEDVFS
ncbi:hypothetical protein AB434_3968 [Heyndrickxia coagulans]|uniref:Uncharacterized protein n=1 Tax=Heyndrickxia coagulans TaxID=1398 RepID=A0AAN0WAR7_HEYCO|nr:hypothetical protein SB48_HM08orf02005 [Heyndrickxia coagulans]AKN56373.1 hypothetical protein AB434_3968 [Heyndrickxia coagulans]KYC73880.1 hypothetical protein B4096_2464 [Heyndrickxia coagulans]